ncbi:class I SAM-dependent methyltransferase [Lactococcus nasutitermitis]|uniref:Class I SAM-dependent methyltransferase n=1 Tax=Lactococcus nasutitermitis TaxID=1652957 RepID=A0ABV9JCV5_9LACT|nr:class I SAM-dependent methyltransferase [Lactococcus nasutitermitis]
MKKHQHKHDYEQESADYYNQIAEKFDHTFDGFLSGFFKRFIVKHLELADAMSVLDIGCANGTLLSMLAERAKIFGTGLDISEGMVQIARKLHPDFTFQQGSAEVLPFQDATFDVLTCSASFHHFPNPSEFFAEAGRVLKSDGRLVIAEIYIPVVTRAYNWRIRRFNTEGDVKVYTPAELAELFAENGWRIVKRKIFLQIQYYELKKM